MLKRRLKCADSTVRMRINLFGPSKNVYISLNKIDVPNVLSTSPTPRSRNYQISLAACEHFESDEEIENCGIACNYVTYAL